MCSPLELFVGAIPNLLL